MTAKNLFKTNAPYRLHGGRFVNRPYTSSTATVETSFLYFNKIIWRQIFRNHSSFPRPRGYCLCEQLSPNIVHYSAFLRKRRNQKTARGSNAAPGAAPLSDVQAPPAAVSDILPLCLLHEMRLRVKDLRLTLARAQLDIGYNPSFIYTHYDCCFLTM